VGDGSLAAGQTREVATGVLPDQVLFLSGLAGGSSQPGALLTEVVVIAIDEGLRQHCTRLEAEVTARNRGDLQGAYREEDVASDRAVEALVDDEARIGFAQYVEEHARPLGRLGGVQPGVDELRVDVRSGLGEEHVAPRAEHDEEANEVVPVEVELEEVDPLVVPEHEPVVLSPEEGDVLVTREIRDEPEVSIARAVPPRDAVLVARSDSAVFLDFPNIVEDLAYRQLLLFLTVVGVAYSVLTVLVFALVFALLSRRGVVERVQNLVCAEDPGTCQ